MGVLILVSCTLVLVLISFDKCCDSSAVKHKRSPYFVLHMYLLIEFQYDLKKKDK